MATAQRSPTLIRAVGQTARAVPWHHSERTAYLTVESGTIPELDFVAHCRYQLVERGYDRVITSALAPAQTSSFLTLGFGVSRRLHLLTHDMRSMPRALGHD